MAKFEPKEERPDADDYRAYFDSSCLRVWHLGGKPLTVRIVDVAALTGEIFAGGKSKVMMQPKLTLKGRDGVLPLPLLLNKTNAKTIARLYGKNPRAWVGHLITLYPTTTDVGGETQECIRVRPEKPADKRKPDDSTAAALLPGDDAAQPFPAPEETLQ